MLADGILDEPVYRTHEKGVFMPRSQEVSDYFFVIESGPDRSQVEVFAAGEGMSVVDALARVSILYDAHDSHRMDVLPSRDSGTYSVYGAVSEASTFRASEGKVYFAADALALSEMLCVPAIKGSFYGTVTKHRTNVFEQLKNGLRSPRDAHAELTDWARDIETLRTASSMWFDNDGMQLVLPIERETNVTSKPQFLLRKVTKRREDHTLDQDLKAEFFGALPDKARAYRVSQLALRKTVSYPYPQWNRPLLRGTDSLQQVYGYVAHREKEFTPVLTLSSDHRRV